MRNGLPVLALCGFGRAGKDTAAEWFRDNTKLVFKGGCSWTALPYMAGRLSADLGREVTVEEAYATRHQDRMKWYNYMNEYRAVDAALIIRDVLKHSDIVCGVRDKCELLTAKKEGLLDLIIWIERDVPVDPTVTYSIEDADIIIRNNSDIETFHRRLRSLASCLGILK